MSEDEATEKLKELVIRCKECKFATCENCEINWNEVQAIETILDLYQNTKYELKGQEALVDTMSHNEEVLIRNYEILEKKLKQEREENNKYIIHLTDKQYNKVIDCAQRDIEKKWKDKIRAKIKELENKKEYCLTIWVRDEIRDFQELLEEE